MREMNKIDVKSLIYLLAYTVNLQTKPDRIRFKKIMNLSNANNLTFPNK